MEEFVTSLYLWYADMAIVERIVLVITIHIILAHIYSKEPDAEE